MIFGFGRQTELLDSNSICWILDVFEWALSNIDVQNIGIGNSLIYPNNEYFPGRESSVEGMAGLIFSQVKSYTGISELHCELKNESGINHSVPTKPEKENTVLLSNNQTIVFNYNSHTLNDPEVLIATFAHQISYFIVTSVPHPPPGGEENRPHAAEVLAVIMGFGVIMANTANTQKIRSCGSCSGPAVERESFLSQYDITYALTIFCVLKNIPAKMVTQHLKKSLRTYFKKSYQEITSNNFPEIDKLKFLQRTYFSNCPDTIQGNK